MKTIEIICEHCGILFHKPINEYNRRNKLNKKMYCSMACSKKIKANIEHLKNIDPKYPVYLHHKKLDAFSDFKQIIRSCKKRKKAFNLDLQYLKDIWENQKGLCPYTNLKLTLDRSKNYITQASLDRIDNSKGYIKGNVEFISLPINYLKADKLSKQEVIDFLKLINLNL